jgi:F0F1-type ATP synthase delta subunit
MADKLAALQAALPSDTPVEISNLLKLLIQEGDLELLPEIGMALAHVATGSTVPTEAEITSAVALSPEEQEKLRKLGVQAIVNKADGVPAVIEAIRQALQRRKAA